MTRRPLFFLALFVLAFGALALTAADQPPRDLKTVGDHWTAWDPPTEFPEGSEVYIIQKGDTLWDLSNQFYSDPYLWPQLWERNRYILDAHWIYPGDPLVVGVEITPIDEVTDTGEGDGDEMADADAGAAGLIIDRSSSPPSPLGAEDDIYCSGFIADSSHPFDYEIIGSEAAWNVDSAPGETLAYGNTSSFILNLSLGMIAYVNGGREGDMMPGTVYTVVRPQGLVRHPTSGDVVGEMYSYRGRVRILSVQDKTGIAEIVHSCHPITVGDLLKPFTPEPVPLARRSGLIGINDPVSHDALNDAAAIVYSGENLFSLGAGHMVYIDRGTADDLAPGDLFTIYRQPQPGLPPLVVGELAVLSVGESASLARIIESRHIIHVGDRLDPKIY